MKTLSNIEALNVLKTASATELAALAPVIRRAVTHKISIEEAVQYESLEVDNKVKYHSIRGQDGFGTIEKINPRYVQIRDAHTNQLQLAVASEVQIHKGRIPKATPVLKAAA